jgi:G:T-mismatch repair DNA endonuclease (very short patch repair protein)
MDRDKYVTRQLRRMGWRVVRVWEHELKTPEKVAGRVKRSLGGAAAG